MDEELYEREISKQQAIEEEAERALEELARALVRIAAPVWRYGDGHGGWVYETINRIAAEEGLDVLGGIQTPRTSLVDLIAKRDGGYYCAYCHVPLLGSPEVPHTEVDHVHPKSRGGSDRLDNRVLACAPCNRAKGALTAAEFEAARAASVRHGLDV